MRDKVEPTTSGGLNTMTPAQQRGRSPARPASIEAARRAAERQRAAQAKAERDAAKARQRSVDNAIRTGGRVVTSRIGQDIIRGVFGTLFGGGRGR